ncbi:hypothetical protein P0D88_37775 [Paraburkholderia sp. RL18-103-BIB-C]|uniref:hypothetical protein n=1 Tax=unclassified Paraburkholderia TaxID=2615204 RepID=UPI0038BA67B9
MDLIVRFAVLCEFVTNAADELLARLSGQFLPEHDIALHFQAVEHQNKPLPIAIIRGVCANGYAALDGAIGVLPLVDVESPGAKSFVARFRKTHNGRDPSQEVSLNYTAVYATALAMKAVGTTTDATAIRAAYDKGVKALPRDNNPQNVNGVDERGGLRIGIPMVAIIQGGKLKHAEMNALASAK